MENDWAARRKAIQATLAEKRGEKTNVVQFPKPTPDEGLPPELAAAVPTASFTEEEKEDVAEHIQSADQRIAREVESIDILRAYDMWIGKMKPIPTPGNPEVFVSCPLPGHADANPSACANTETNLWMCYRCQEGGDILDLAAIKYDMPDYKTGQNFHNLYRKIAQNDLGWSFENEGGFQVGYSPEDQRKRYEAAQKQLEEEREQLKQDELAPKNVIDINTGEGIDEDEEDDDPHFGDPFKLDWGPLVKEGTFLDEYMKACSISFIPEEFHFWNGLVALGFAAGRTVKLEETYGNLFVCHMGPTSGGKSSSTAILETLLANALPFDPNEPDHDGVYLLPAGAGGEIIIDELRGLYKSKPGNKPPMIPLGYTPGNIKGLISYDELTELLGKISRQNSTLKETLFKLYDCRSRVDTASRTSGISVAMDPFASLVTTTQPLRLRMQLTKDDAYSGFLNRMIFTAGPKKRKPTRGRVKIDIGSAAMKLKGVFHWINVVHGANLTLDWNEEAASLWDDFCENTIYKTMDSGSETVKRLDGAMIKIVLLLSINSMEQQVSRETVERAIGLWDYMLKTYRAIDSQVMVSSVTEMENDILAYAKKRLIKGKEYVTAAEICKGLQHKYERPDMIRSIETLLKIGELENAVLKPTTAKGGRPPKTAYVVRSLLA